MEKNELFQMLNSQMWFFCTGSTWDKVTNHMQISTLFMIFHVGPQVAYRFLKETNAFIRSSPSTAAPEGSLSVEVPWKGFLHKIKDLSRGRPSQGYPSLWGRGGYPAEPETWPIYAPYMYIPLPRIPTLTPAHPPITHCFVLLDCWYYQPCMY